MTKHILLLVVIACVWATDTVQAQQDAMYTHYMHNTLAINPGYAGSRDALTVTALHRSQWISFPGAPVTQTLTVHAPVFNEKIGLGLSIVNDKLGPLRQTQVTIDAAYILNINRNDRLSIGIKGGGNFFRGEFGSINTGNTQQADNVFASDIGSKLSPDFGFGAYYYKPRMYVGISVPSLLNTSYENDDVVTYERLRHYYLIGGAVFDINFDWKFKPTTFLKVTEGAPIEFDITPTFLFREQFELGLMYRSGDAVGLLAGVNLSKQLLLSYSFDWSFTNPTGKYNSGSHEIMLRYDFIYKHRRKIQSPRYF